MVDASQLNPFSNFNIGLGAVGNALLLVVIITIIFGLVGWLIYWRLETRKYIYKIPLYQYINGTNYHIGDYRAKNVNISKAGDSLWYVKKAKRWIEPAHRVSGKNEFPHELTRDGEWVNFELESVDVKRKQANVKYTHQDMRSNRVAIGHLLEQRLINKGFWEKYKDVIINIIFFFIVAIAMVVIFWQWGKIIEGTADLLGSVKNIADSIGQLECVTTSDGGLVPA